MRHTTALIIGAGQSGLAMSRAFSRRGIDHLVLEAGRVGESWRTQRWDSLRLLTPNWINTLPGETYRGNDPEGFMSVAEMAGAFDNWTARHAPPVIENVSVHSLKRNGAGYLCETSFGLVSSRIAVVATGAYARPKIPAFASELGPGITQLTSLDYKSPGALPKGGVLVVGSSASGLQIARELALAGRRVMLAVGSHMRLPRRYRDADIVTWMHRVGILDEPPVDDHDLERQRGLPSLPLIGTPERAQIDLNALQELGVEITGRLAGLREDEALFSGSLANACAMADLKMYRLLDRVDEWIADHGLSGLARATRLPPTQVPEQPRLGLNFGKEGIRSVVWATGLMPDHRFVDLPVFDRKGRIAHDRGMVEPGLAVMGLPYMRSARSMSLSGAEPDAEALAGHLLGRLAKPLAA